MVFDGWWKTERNEETEREDGGKKRKKLRIQCQRVLKSLKNLVDAIYLFQSSCGCGLGTSCRVYDDTGWLEIGNKGR